MKDLLQRSSATGLNDALVNALGTLGGRPAQISAMEYNFIGGSMGSVVGEMVTLAVERSTRKKRASSWFQRRRRPHAGTLSLLQMGNQRACPTG
jgi:acetyl-CoA carboxylase carboxyl transferase subunit beta